MKRSSRMGGDLDPSFVCLKRKRTRSSKKEKQNSLIVMTLSEVFELHFSSEIISDTTALVASDRPSAIKLACLLSDPM